MPEIVAIIQGRMSSSRLPGKVLLDIAGKPMLQHVIERVQRSRRVDKIVVATSKDVSDDPIGQFCVAADVACSRGSLHDVLDRFYQAANEHQADVIVRITADCPMIDPQLVDETIALVVPTGAGGVDFSCNRLPPPFRRTFPIGLDVEVCTFEALQRAWRESTELFHREHVMPYLYEAVELQAAEGLVSAGVSPRGFRVAVLNHAPDYGSLRWTVDTPEDLLFAREILSRLKDKPFFGWHDILEILQKEPQLAEINSGIRHKSMKEVDERAKQ